jgi:hypothetical protein
MGFGFFFVVGIGALLVDLFSDDCCSPHSPE